MTLKTPSDIWSSVKMCILTLITSNIFSCRCLDYAPFDSNSGGSLTNPRLKKFRNFTGCELTADQIFTRIGLVLSSILLKDQKLQK